jgi:hypothetical protein
MRALTAIVEDKMGEGAWMQFYQQPDEAIRPALSITGEGDVFIIKEPWLKIMGEGEYVVRIDHLSDLLRIDTCHKMWPKKWKSSFLGQMRGADDWKKEGNFAMKRQEHWKAIRKHATNFPVLQTLINFLMLVITWLWQIVQLFQRRQSFEPIVH